MKKEKTETLDEIVFENRNKEYGAYYLRKAYKKYTTRSMLIGIAALLLATIIPFLIFKQARSVNVEKTVGAEFTELNKAPEDAPPPPPPPPPPAEMEQKVKFTAPVVTTDTVEETSALLNQDELNSSSATTAPITDEQEITVDETENKVIEQQAPVFTIVELMPGYNGGEEAMYKYLSDNIKYPQVAKETGIQGNVIVTFVVEKDGTITSVSVLKDIGGGCGEEALRVVKAMPKWNAGKQNGVPVRVQFNLPIRFTLQ
jgi:periplasmic protein TonB